MARNLAVGKRTFAEGSRLLRRESGRGEPAEPSGPQWEDAAKVPDLAGPLMLLASPSDSQRDGHGRLLVCLDDGLLAFKDPADAPTNVDSRGRICPADVRQVVLGQVLVPGRVSLKAANRKYLSAHPSGRVNASRDAVGPTEEWRPSRVAAGFAFQDVFDRYLSADSRDGRVTCEMRDEPGPREIFGVRRQIVPETSPDGAGGRTSGGATKGSGQESYPKQLFRREARSGQLTDSLLVILPLRSSCWAAASWPRPGNRDA